MMKAPEITTATTEDEMKEIAKTAIPDPLIAEDVARFEEAHRAERPLIPNPYFDDPEQIFAWDVIEGSEEVEVVPRGGVPLAAEMVDAAERIYGLNRAELKRLRFKQFAFYRAFRTTADAAGVPPEIRELNLQMIETMKQPDSPYSAMIRFFEAQGAG